MPNWITRKLRTGGARVCADTLQADGGAPQPEAKSALKPSSSSTPGKSLLELPHVLRPRSNSLTGLHPAALHVPRFLRRCSHHFNEGGDGPAPLDSSGPSHSANADGLQEHASPKSPGQRALPEVIVSPTDSHLPASDHDKERTTAPSEIATAHKSDVAPGKSQENQAGAPDSQKSHVDSAASPDTTKDESNSLPFPGPEEDFHHFGGFGGAPEGLASGLVVPSDKAELPPLPGLSGAPQLGELPAVLMSTLDDWMSPHLANQAVKAS